VVGMNICACVAFAYNNSWLLASRPTPIELLYDRDRRVYAEKHRREIRVSVGDSRISESSPSEEFNDFWKQGKLSPRFIGPFEILERIGEVSYRLALPSQLSHVHDVFHVSLLGIPISIHCMSILPFRSDSALYVFVRGTA
ncbi:hypothetical protein Tco_0206464, partial [Tanacetum coccineum]